MIRATIREAIVVARRQRVRRRHVNIGYAPNPHQTRIQHITQQESLTAARYTTRKAWQADATDAGCTIQMYEGEPVAVLGAGPDAQFVGWCPAPNQGYLDLRHPYKSAAGMTAAITESMRHAVAGRSPMTQSPRATTMRKTESAVTSYFNRGGMHPEQDGTRITVWTDDDKDYADACSIYQGLGIQAEGLKDVEDGNRYGIEFKVVDTDGPDSKGDPASQPGDYDNQPAAIQPGENKSLPANKQGKRLESFHTGFPLDSTELVGGMRVQFGYDTGSGLHIQDGVVFGFGTLAEPAKFKTERELLAALQLADLDAAEDGRLRLIIRVDDYDASLYNDAGVWVIGNGAAMVDFYDVDDDGATGVIENPNVHEAGKPANKQGTRLETRRRRRVEAAIGGLEVMGKEDMQAFGGAGIPSAGPALIGWLEHGCAAVLALDDDDQIRVGCEDLLNGQPDGDPTFFPDDADGYAQAKAHILQVMSDAAKEQENELSGMEMHPDEQTGYEFEASGSYDIPQKAWEQIPLHLWAAAQFYLKLADRGGDEQELLKKATSSMDQSQRDQLRQWLLQNGAMIDAPDGAPRETRRPFVRAGRSEGFAPLRVGGRSEGSGDGMPILGMNGEEVYPGDEVVIGREFVQDTFYDVIFTVRDIKGDVVVLDMAAPLELLSAGVEKVGASSDHAAPATESGEPDALPAKMKSLDALCDWLRAHGMEEGEPGGFTVEPEGGGWYSLFMVNDDCHILWDMLGIYDERTKQVDWSINPITGERLNDLNDSAVAEAAESDGMPDDFEVEPGDHAGFERAVFMRYPDAESASGEANTTEYRVDGKVVAVWDNDAGQGMIENPSVREAADAPRMWTRTQAKQWVDSWTRAQRRQISVAASSPRFWDMIQDLADEVAPIAEDGELPISPSAGRAVQSLTPSQRAAFAQRLQSGQFGRLRGAQTEGLNDGGEVKLGDDVRRGTSRTKYTVKQLLPATAMLTNGRGELVRANVDELLPWHNQSQAAPSFDHDTGTTREAAGGAAINAKDGDDNPVAVGDIVVIDSHVTLSDTMEDAEFRITGITRQQDDPDDPWDYATLELVDALELNTMVLYKRDPNESGDPE